MAIIPAKKPAPGATAVTDEQVEASAAALCALDNVDRAWPNDFYDYQMEEYRVKARAALNANVVTPER